MPGHNASSPPPRMVLQSPKMHTFLPRMASANTSPDRTTTLQLLDTNKGAPVSSLRDVKLYEHHQVYKLWIFFVISWQMNIRTTKYVSVSLTDKLNYAEIKSRGLSFYMLTFTPSLCSVAKPLLRDPVTTPLSLTLTKKTLEPPKLKSTISAVMSLSAL